MKVGTTGISHLIEHYDDYPGSQKLEECKNDSFFGILAEEFKKREKKIFKLIQKQ